MSVAVRLEIPLGAQDDRGGVRRFGYLALLVAAVFVPAASPSGAPGLPGKIAFLVDVFRGGSSYPEILVFRAGGGGRWSLTKDLDCGTPYAPAWSRDGSLLAFGCYSVGRVHGVYVISRDGSGLRRVLVGPVTHISWSPDGRRLAFTGGFLGASTRVGIYIADTATGRMHRLIRSNSGSVSWSADGRRSSSTGGARGTGLARSGRSASTATDCGGEQGARFRARSVPGRPQDLVRVGRLSLDRCDEHRWQPRSPRRPRPVRRRGDLVAGLALARDSVRGFGKSHGIYVFPADGSRAPRRIAPGLRIQTLTWAP